MKGFTWNGRLETSGDKCKAPPSSNTSATIHACSGNIKSEAWAEPVPMLACVQQEGVPRLQQSSCHRSVCKFGFQNCLHSTPAVDETTTSRAQGTVHIGMAQFSYGRTFVWVSNSHESKMLVSISIIFSSHYSGLLVAFDDGFGL